MGKPEHAGLRPWSLLGLLGLTQLMGMSDEATQTSCPNNLLANPGFEEGFRRTEAEGTSLSSAVANHWYPWFIRGDQMLNREPEFKVISVDIDPTRIRSGYQAQKFFTTYATHTAGFYQQVAVPPGSQVTFSIFVQVYTGQADIWNGQTLISDRQEPGSYRVYVGVDPYGRLPAFVGAPPPDSIVWSAPLMEEAYDVFTPLSVTTTALGDAVTLYTRGEPEWPVKHNDSNWDDACLTVVTLTPTATATPIPTAASSPTATPIPSSTPTSTASPSPTPTHSVAPPALPTATPAAPPPTGAPSGLAVGGWLALLLAIGGLVGYLVGRRAGTR